MKRTQQEDPLWDRLNLTDHGSVDYWKPSVGDAVLGEILDIDFRTAKHSGRTPVITIADELSGKTLEVWAMHTVLRSELKKLAPAVGDRVGIRRQPDSEKGYRRFLVVGDSERTPVDWDSVSAAGADMSSPDLTPEAAKLIGVGSDDGPLPF